MKMVTFETEWAAIDSEMVAFDVESVTFDWCKVHIDLEMLYVVQPFSKTNC